MTQSSSRSQRSALPWGGHTLSCGLTLASQEFCHQSPRQLPGAVTPQRCGREDGVEGQMLQHIFADTLTPLLFTACLQGYQHASREQKDRRSLNRADSLALPVGIWVKLKFF